MATPPTVVTHKDAYAWIDSGTATRALTQISVTTGDTIAVIVTSADFPTTGTFTIAKTAGTAVIGAITTKQTAGTTSHCGLTLLTCPVTTGGTLTITVTRSASTAAAYLTIMTYVASSCGGVGTTAATLTSTTTITASLTTAANSYVGVYATDWAAVGSATTTFTPAGAVADITETDGATNQSGAGSQYSSRAGHWLNSGNPATTSYGVTVPTSSAYNLVAFELLAATGPTGPTATVIVGHSTFGYAGVVQNAGTTATVLHGTVTLAPQTLTAASNLTAAPIVTTADVLTVNFWSFLDWTGVDDTPGDYTVVVDESIVEYVGVEDEHDQFWIAYGEELTDTDTLADDVSESATSTAPQPDAILASATVATPTVDTTVDPRPIVVTSTALVGSLQVQQDRTLTPAIVAATGTLPTVQVRQDRTIAISGRVAAATTVPALAPAVGSVIPATAIVGRSTVAGQTVQRDASQTATPIAPPAVTLPAPGVTAVSSENPTPAVIGATSTVPFPGVSVGVTVATVTAVTTLATAAAAASSTATPASLSPAAGIRIPVAAITAARAATAPAAPITTAAAVGTLPPELGQTVQPEILAGTCTIPEAAPAADSTVSADPIIATATVGELAVSQDVETLADVITTASTVTVATLRTGVTVTAEIVSATVSFTETAAVTSQNIAADVITTAATIVQPEEITHAAAATAAVLTVDAAVLIPNIYTVPDHPPVINPTRTRNTNPISRLRVINGAGAVHVPPSAVHARLTY